MTITKSEAAARVVAGISVETFHHATLGLFNITATRHMIQALPEIFQPIRVSFADIKAEGRGDLDAAGVVAWLIGQREVCPKRCAELTRRQLKEPIIGMTDATGMHYIIDGIHRLSERFNRGFKDYETYVVPMFAVPRLRHGTYIERPWGEMEVRDGQLLKRAAP